MPSTSKGLRIAKWLANCGVCSRRQAEEWIAQGRVSYQGNTIQSPIFFLSSPEGLCVDGNPVTINQTTQVWMFYKPRGVVTSRKDTHGRPTVYDYIPQNLGHIMNIGRLDIESEGLLLFTNNGDYAQKMAHPSSEIPRTYRVKIYGHFSQEKMKSLEKGLSINGVFYKPIKWTIESQRGQQTWIHLTLVEGKNREIRKVMNHLGFDVSRLIRTAYGPYVLGAMKPGQWKEASVKPF